MIGFLMLSVMAAIVLYAVYLLGYARRERMIPGDESARYNALASQLKERNNEVERLRVMTFALLRYLIVVYQEKANLEHDSGLVRDKLQGDIRDLLTCTTTKKRVIIYHPTMKRRVPQV